MTQPERIENAMKWAEILRKSSGSVESSYQDGEITAVATKEGVKVTVDGVEVHNA